MKSYSETAYDSTRPRELGPAIDDAERNWAGRKLRERKLDSLPVSCAEFLTLDANDAHNANRDEKSRQQLLKEPLVVGWMSLSNPIHILAIAQIGAALFGWSALVGLLIMLPLWGPSYSSQETHTIEWMVMVGGGLIISYYVIEYLIKNDKIPNRNNTLFEGIKRTATQTVAREAGFRGLFGNLRVAMHRYPGTVAGSQAVFGDSRATGASLALGNADSFKFREQRANS